METHVSTRLFCRLAEPRAMCEGLRAAALAAAAVIALAAASPAAAGDYVHELDGRPDTEEGMGSSAVGTILQVLPHLIPRDPGATGRDTPSVGDRRPDAPTVRDRQPDGLLTPGVVGLTPAAAYQTIRRARLSPAEVERRLVAGVDAPRVVRQYPGKGHPVAAGTVVRYWVTAPPPRTEPPVTRPRPQRPPVTAVILLPPPRKPPVPGGEVVVAELPPEPQTLPEPLGRPVTPERAGEPKVVAPPPEETPVIAAPRRKPAASVVSEPPVKRPRILPPFVTRERVLFAAAGAPLLIIPFVFVRRRLRRARQRSPLLPQATLLWDGGRQSVVFDDPDRRSLTVSVRPRSDAGVQTVRFMKEAA